MTCAVVHAEMLAKCVQKIGTLLVNVVDTKGAVNTGLLKALEAFVICLSSMPDIQQVGRYPAAHRTPLLWSHPDSISHSPALLSLQTSTQAHHV